MTEKTKKVIFSMSENDKAKFKVQLQYDSLTQAAFFRGVLSAYLNKDNTFMNFISELKSSLGSQSKPQIKKVKKNLQEASITSRQFALEDDEVENIFDILEKEHPDL
jgi:hypothetical protein